MKNKSYRLIDYFIYLLLAVIGFYWGRFHGSFFLISFYFLYSHYPRLKNQKKNNKIKPINLELKQACEQLQVSLSCNLKELVRVRRKLLNQYHPDKLIKPTVEQKQQAEEKINQINHAFNLIKQIRKL